MQDLLDTLNQAQKKAVTLPDEHALVLAGAGSGKTRVLTSRIIYLLREGRAYKNEILAVTFTNKAAKEMLTRISANCALGIRGMWVGTFHGMCNRFLRKHAKEAGLPENFQILDQTDQLSMIRRVMKNHGISEELHPPKAVQNFIAGVKEEGLRAKDVQVMGHQGPMLEIYALYEKACEREGVADFAELLLRTYELFARDDRLREHYQRRFKYVLVDEFQDTNRLQYKWLKLLGGFDAKGVREREVNTLFAVGDDDQSIYSFRGANVGNMQEFLRDFSIGEVIKLEENYRSQGHILDAANELIANNTDRLGKNLWTRAGSGDKIAVFRADDERLEAEFIADEIHSRVRQGVSPEDIAVLYRANAQSRVIEQTLLAHGIAYRVYGGLRFFDRAEVKNAIAYLRLIENPRDDTAFARVVNFPARGIGAKTLETLTELAQSGETSLFEAIASFAGSGAARLRAFRELIETMAFEFSQLPLPELVDRVVERSGLRAFYESEKEGTERLENLSELTSAARAYVQAEGLEAVAEEGDEDVPELEGLSGFLSYAALESGATQAADGMPAVQLMTVHAAKGLEFNTVFISGVEEGLFPHVNSMGSAVGLAEERRLMYVAITRAKRKLFITFAESRMMHGRFHDAGESMFLREISSAHLARINGEGGYADRGLNPAFARQQAWRGFRQAGLAQPVGGNAPLKVKSAMGYTIGEKVVHKKFGLGTVEALLGQGEDARIRIRFDGLGAKELMLSLARLEKLN